MNPNLLSKEQLQEIISLNDRRTQLTDMEAKCHEYSSVSVMAEDMALSLQEHNSPTLYWVDGDGCGDRIGKRLHVAVTCNGPDAEANALFIKKCYELMPELLAHIDALNEILRQRHSLEETQTEVIREQQKKIDALEATVRSVRELANDCREHGLMQTELGRVARMITKALGETDQIAVDVVNVDSEIASAELVNKRRFVDLVPERLKNVCDETEQGGEKK